MCCGAVTAVVESQRVPFAHPVFPQTIWGFQTSELSSREHSPCCKEPRLRVLTRGRCKPSFPTHFLLKVDSARTFNKAFLIIAAKERGVLIGGGIFYLAEPPC